MRQTTQIVENLIHLSLNQLSLLEQHFTWLIISFDAFLEWFMLLVINTLIVYGRLWFCLDQIKRKSLF